MNMEDIEESEAFKTGRLWKCTCPYQWVLVSPPWKPERLGWRQICTGKCKP